MPRGLGEVLTICKLGVTDVKWFATDLKGNQSAVQTQRFLIAADQKDGTVGGSVPATLSLTLGAPATFGAFTPGVAREYTASTTATVISTAGDATLPSRTRPNPGHLVNGAFALPQPLQGWASSRRGPPRPRTSTSRSRSSRPSAPTTRCAPAAYSKTLTFTLSTTDAVGSGSGAAPLRRRGPRVVRA